MIDIETLAAPAFLIEVTSQGTLAEARLNAVGRSHPSLMHALSARACLDEPGSRRDRRDEESPWPLLGGCAARRLTRDVTLTSSTSDGSPF